MTRAMFRCPLSRRDVFTGALFGPEGFEERKSTGSFVCTDCGLVHNWYRSEIWLEVSPAASAAN